MIKAFFWILIVMWVPFMADLMYDLDEQTMGGIGCVLSMMAIFSWVCPWMNKNIL